MSRVTPAEITALISAVTALVTAITALAHSVNTRKGRPPRKIVKAMRGVGSPPGPGNRTDVLAPGPAVPAESNTFANITFRPCGDPLCPFCGGPQ